MERVDNRRWKKWVRYGLLFFVVLEVTAQLGYELRPHAIYPPLAWIPGPAPHQTVLARRTSEQGTPSEIDRGQKMQWAVVGTSWTDAMGVPQDEIWPTLLQRRFLKNDVHVENYSGDSTSAVQTLRYLRLSGRHFEKIFITLDGPVEGLTDTGEWMLGFQHSYRWFNVRSRFPLCLLMVVQLFKTSEFYQTFHLPDFFPEASAANDKSSSTLSIEKETGLSGCYPREMTRLDCKKAYWHRRESEPTIDPWVIWRETFLPCQLKADRHCGVPVRANEMPYSVESRILAYEKNVKEAYRLGLQVANRVYLVSHPMLGIATDLPDGATDMTASSLPLVNTAPAVITALSTLAGIEFRLRKTVALEAIGTRLTPDTVNLHTQLLAPPEDRRQLFLDSTHISPVGHRRVADIIEARLRRDDPRLGSSEDQSASRQ